MLLFDVTVTFIRRQPDGGHHAMTHTFRIPSLDTQTAATAAVGMADAVREGLEEEFPYEAGDNNRYGWKMSSDAPVVALVSDPDHKLVLPDELPLIGSDKRPVVPWWAPKGTGDGRVAVVLQIPETVVTQLAEMQGRLDIAASDLAARYLSQNLDDAARRLERDTRDLEDHMQIISYQPDGTAIAAPKRYPREEPVRW